MAMSQKPLIAVTLGDPTGIGPEVVAKALARPDIYRFGRPVVVGRCAVLERTAAALGLEITIERITGGLPSCQPSARRALVWEAGVEGVEGLPYGAVHPRAGRAAMDYIEEAARLALDGRVAALATAPVNKAALAAAGIQDIGHQEVLSRMAQAPEVTTMLVAGPLRAVHLSTHYPLAEAVRLVKRERVLARLRLTHRQWLAWGMAPPRIAVAALNPHGGDEGLLGREEIEEIAPAVADARAEGIDVHGPFPVDSLFPQARDGRWDAVLVHYHDQGHIPLKMQDFMGSVSVNLGLPFVRTSVDHGTAFDIAGRGVADASGMVEAIRLAARLAMGLGFAPTPGVAEEARR